MTKHRPRVAVDQAAAEPDTTELELQELVVLWPRLEAALARDTAGPSAAPTGSSGAGATAPTVFDLDTQRVRTLITVEVDRIAAEIVPLLGLTPPAEQLRQLRARSSAASARAAAARRELSTLSTTLAVRRCAAVAAAVPPWAPDMSAAVLTPAERDRGRAAATAVVTHRREIARLSSSAARVEASASTLGVLEQLPGWYAQLRDRDQPLARYIRDDVASWVRAARSALRLSTGGYRIGWLCPHHRAEHPTELRRVADQAQLASSVLAGRTQDPDEAPLRWQRNGAVECRHCRERWDGVQALSVLMRMIEHADAEGVVSSGAPPARPPRRVLLLNGPDLAAELGRAPQTLRAWALAGFITRHGVDANGRTLFDVEEVMGVSARAERRRRGLINSERPTTRVPGA